MKSCFGYVRVSTAKQGEGVSLEAQRDAIVIFAERNNIAIVQWFEEKETAAKSGRPIFLSMMKSLMKRKAEGVVLHKVDRGARNLADWAKFAELADAGIDVHFANETLDFRSRGGRLTADIQAVIAADYIRNLREECIKGIDGRLKQGLYPFKAPIGYLDNGGGKVKTIDPMKGPLVKEGFQLYASGSYSLRSLPVKLAEMGLLGPNGRKLSKNGLERMLRNPFYCGVIRVTRGRDIYQGIHEPLISPALFDAVQKVREGRIAKAVTKHLYTYRGLFSCQLCGTTLVAERQKGHVYYRCHTKLCETKTVREEVLETEISSILSYVRITDEDIEWLSTEFESWLQLQTFDCAARTYEMQLSQLEEKLRRLTDALIDHLIDKETFGLRKEGLMLERARLNEAKKKCQVIPEPGYIKKFLELVKNLSLTYQLATREEKRQMLQLTTSNRTVSRKNVYVEPADWLTKVETAITGLLGGDSRPNSRSSPNMSNPHVKKLLDSLEGYKHLTNENVDDSG